jgi:hypothetical protein
MSKEDQEEEWEDEKEDFAAQLKCDLEAVRELLAKLISHPSHLLTQHLGTQRG